MGLFDVKPLPPSDDPADYVYEAQYNHCGRVTNFKFNPCEGAIPLEHARNVVFQNFKDDSGAIPQDLYVEYLNSQASLTVKKHHRID